MTSLVRTLSTTSLTSVRPTIIATHRRSGSNTQQTTPHHHPHGHHHHRHRHHEKEESWEESTDGQGDTNGGEQKKKEKPWWARTGEATSRGIGAIARSSDAGDLLAEDAGAPDETSAMMSNTSKMLSIMGQTMGEFKNAPPALHATILGGKIGVKCTQIAYNRHRRAKGAASTIDMPTNDEPFTFDDSMLEESDLSDDYYLADEGTPQGSWNQDPSKPYEPWSPPMSRTSSMRSGYQRTTPPQAGILATIASSNTYTGPRTPSRYAGPWSPSISSGPLSPDERRFSITTSFTTSTVSSPTGSYFPSMPKPESDYGDQPPSPLSVRRNVEWSQHFRRASVEGSQRQEESEPEEYSEDEDGRTELGEHDVFNTAGIGGWGEEEV
ncbi:hypothetical protein M231_03028 [Tremella mesenterica]|uniref:Uncharacterized protein n=1 Tax=Tremella mesenterica TaxID=5217 RepID=A0A4Q1BP65_TREME|nr:uncharacterized protein TREMEDRAFT_65357 [Tremella mesenterica DSM 1558]EIW66495.1 hypothetical protein TREMEDRAFT_65357 [Tremella mesenterica DSM 1558]RXK39674.1 hypothetical protein M231_03028 [Tremella mesenterica]